METDFTLTLENDDRLNVWDGDGEAIEVEAATLKYKIQMELREYGIKEVNIYFEEIYLQMETQSRTLKQDPEWQYKMDMEGVNLNAGIRPYMIDVDFREKCITIDFNY